MQLRKPFISNFKFPAIFTSKWLKAGKTTNNISWNHGLALIINFLVNGSEPKIYQKQNRHGEIYFRVYDPFTQRYYKFNSEQEVRVWLEERYR